MIYKIIIGTLIIIGLVEAGYIKKQNNNCYEETITICE